MANNNNAVSSSFPPRQFHCEDCSLYFDSAKSLEVHLQYHKENLYVKWAAQSQRLHNDSETNSSLRMKDETVSAPADSSDNMITKPSPEFQHNRATPETSAPFGHPATPQSYNSAPSPYQNPDQTSFNQNSQFPQQFPHSQFPPTQSQHGEQLNWEQPHYGSEFTTHKVPRFHPYNVPDRISQVSSSSPIYGQSLNQPTPSPSPNQCDKCGFVCDSAVQLTEHCNNAHSATSQNHFQSPPPFAKTFPGYPENSVKVKEEQEESADILDLDSQKVVYQSTDENNSSSFDQPPTQNETNQRPVSSMIPWPEQKVYSPQPHINGSGGMVFKSEPKMFNEQKPFSPEQKAYTDLKHYHDPKNFSQGHHIQNNQKPFLLHEQKIYPSAQLPSLSDYQSNNSNSNHDMKPAYRPYDSSNASQISSTQATNPTSSAIPPIGGKGANWKSNEARRPKTYNCTACNKWFTSSGHLKRHYNTTLHKNAVRSSGQPDPATLPISTHHHPARDPNHTTRGAPTLPTDSNTHSPGIADDGRCIDDPTIQSSFIGQGYDRSHRPGVLQTKSPYLQQGNIDNSFLGNNPLVNHSLPSQIGSHPLNLGNQPPGIGNPLDTNHHGSKVPLTNSSVGNPPNGEAGPSVTPNHLRGLLSISTNNISIPALPQTTPPLTAHTLPPFSHLSANPYSPRSSDTLAPTGPDPTHTALYLGQNFQQTLAPNYPNGMAPHVMDMAINNLHIANPVTFGEVTEDNINVTEIDMSNAPLPSFAQLQTQRFGIMLPNYLPAHNVGGSGPGDLTNGQGYMIVDSTDGIHEYKYFDNPSLSVSNDDYPYEIKDVKLLSFDIKDSLKYEVVDYGDKENYEAQVKTPESPESVKSKEYDNNGSPSITSTVSGPPLMENNKMAAKTSIHKCHECKKLFNKACYLTQHNKTFHSGLKPFKCSRCGKRFADDESFEGHYSKHAGIKPFKCQLCPKSFNHKTDLRRHMCLHSGKKPFSCQHCGKGFIRKDHMLKHYDTHLKKNNRQSVGKI